MSSLTIIDSESFISISRTKEEHHIDYESGYEKWKRQHPRLKWVSRGRFRPSRWETSVDPRGAVFRLWTLVAFTAVAFNCVALPFAAFSGERSLRWQICDLASDSVYLLDVLVKSRLRFMRDGLEETTASATRTHYLKGCLFRDLLSVFPTEIFGFFLLETPLWRLNRLLKADRFLDLFRFGEASVVTQVARIVFFSALLCHWNALAIFLLRFTQTAEGNATSDMAASVAQGVVHEFCMAKNISLEKEKTLEAVCQPCSPWAKDYVFSFYCSCTAMMVLGEQVTHPPNSERRPTQLAPRNNVETIFLTSETLLGTFVFSVLVGLAAVLIGNSNRRETEHQFLVDGLKTYMDFRGVTDDMGHRVLDHLAKGNFVAEPRDILPSNLFLAFNRGTALLPLAKSPLFHGTGHSFLGDLGRQLSSFHFGPGDVLTRIGEEQKELWIVVQGRVVSEEDGKEVGEGEILGAEGLLLGRRWESTHFSRGYSQIFAITRKSLFNILTDYPNLVELLYSRAVQLTDFDGNTDHPMSTMEKLEEASEISERLREALDREYAHFVGYSTLLKRRLHAMEKTVAKDSE